MKEKVICDVVGMVIGRHHHRVSDVGADGSGKQGGQAE